jgi:catechol 2,3-dioxygenase-like lactoylglutathione lyase family enzyme
MLPDVTAPDQHAATSDKELVTLSPPDLGRALTHFGVNLLVRDTGRSIAFLEAVFGFTVLRHENGFALLRLDRVLVQLHADATYGHNPLPSLLPELGPRGGGVELRLFECDPDAAEARARARGDTVLRGAEDRPHGLRECYVLDPDGYAWVPSRRLQINPS